MLDHLRAMHKLKFITSFFSVGMVVVLLFGGCAVYDRFFGEKEERSPAELMGKGMESLERGNYEAATEAFQDIKDRYPYSKFAVTAELKMADALYMRKEFEQAYDAYDEFERLHPKNENIPYVIYQKGMCNFRQLTTIDRDQTYTLKAKEEFERLVRRFPRDEYARKARKNSRKCIVYLAEHELYIGHFYYKMGKYEAAMNRYSHIIQNYPDMGQYHEALDYISKCKEKLSPKGKE